ncbi:hypothetical protein Sjap_024436 [Stephania japonica]|uniref:Uncharacterized protein n=1 Tax=Stephania japonica TaxID=461633 RepID=A0AAP0HLH4_9MAGN
MTCPASMMERLRMQSPIGDVVQDRFVTSIDDDISAPSDDRNEDHDNDIDEDVCPLEDAAPSVNWESINVVTTTQPTNLQGRKTCKMMSNLQLTRRSGWKKQAMKKITNHCRCIMKLIGKWLILLQPNILIIRLDGTCLIFGWKQGMCFDNKKDLQRCHKIVAC